MAEERPGEIRRLVGFNADVVLKRGVDRDLVVVIDEHGGRAVESDGLTREQQERLRDALTEHLGDATLSLYARELVADIIRLPSLPSADSCCAVLNEIRERAETIMRGEFPCVNRDTAERAPYAIAFVTCAVGHTTTMRAESRPVRADVTARCSHDASGGPCGAPLVQFGFC